MGSSGGGNSDQMIKEQRRLKDEEEKRLAFEQSKNDLTSSNLAKRVLKSGMDAAAIKPSNLTSDFTGV